MADQVIPLGSLATGLPSALLVAGSPRPLPEKARPAKPAEPQSESKASEPSAKSAESADQAVAQLNSHLQQAGTELKFKVDRETGRTVFQIVKDSSGEVLLQVPSDELLAMARKLRQFQEQMGKSGVLLDKEG